MTRIRPATVEDAPQILDFLSAMAAEAGETIASTEDTIRAHGFGPQPRFHGVMADDADGPLGMVLFFPEYSTWRGEMGLFVQDIYVAPRARGLQLGRQLLARAMASAHWDPRFLTLMVAHDNTAARAFYAGLGMEPRDQADQLILQGQGLAALMNR